MKRGETLAVPGLGNLLISSVNGDYVHGTWQSGVLKGREAGCSARALAGRDVAEEAPRRRSSRKALEGTRTVLLEALHEGPVALTSWAQEEGVSEGDARSAVGALRRAGHAVVSLGEGKFGL